MVTLVLLRAEHPEVVLTPKGPGSCLEPHNRAQSLTGSWPNAYTLNLQGKGHQVLGEALGNEVVLLAGAHLKLLLCISSLV